MVELKRWFTSRRKFRQNKKGPLPSYPKWSNRAEAREAVHANQLSDICKYQVSNLWTFNGIFSVATTRALGTWKFVNAPFLQF